MGLPETRNTTYGVGSDVKSADLDDIQDNIVAGKHGVISKTIYASRGQPHSVGTATFVDNGWQQASGSPIIKFDLDLPAGARIDAITIYGFESGSASYTGKIYEYDGAGARTQKSTTKTSGTTNAWTTIGWTSADADIPLTLVAGKSYYVEVALLGANVTVGQIKITYAKP